MDNPNSKSTNASIKAELFSNGKVKTEIRSFQDESIAIFGAIAVACLIQFTQSSESIPKYRAKAKLADELQEAFKAFDEYGA